MKDDQNLDPRAAQRQEDHQRRRDLKRALGFGIGMATVQMGILLYFMYC